MARVGPQRQRKQNNDDDDNNNNNNKEENKSLLGRNENDLKNEMKIVQIISKEINMNFG
jgi:hypothetical protein